MQKLRMKKYRNFIIFFFACELLLSACTTLQKSAPELPPTEKTPPYSQKGEIPAARNIDLDGLQNFLRLQMGQESLGYREKAFDTCKVGYGFSSSSNCQKQYMFFIQYRIQCRDSEGTVSEVVTDANLSPLSQGKMSWSLKGIQGLTETDHQGYGMIRGISSTSQAQQRLRMVNGEEVLYLRAIDVKKIMVPQYWCR